MQRRLGKSFAEDGLASELYPKSELTARGKGLPPPLNIRELSPSTTTARAFLFEPLPPRAAIHNLTLGR
jgi:hypothetical protein